MGLDTSHDCWHGGYISFTRWRQALATAAGIGSLYDMRGYGGTKPWNDADVLTVLLNHSDCDGEIAAADCAPLADRLEGLLPKLIELAEAGQSEPWKNVTVRFIEGLRRAAAAGEPVDFH